MNKYLILVKHSLPKIDENVPAREWELSEEGRVRAEQLAEELRRFQPDVIISSNERKAKETAKIIGKLHRSKFSIAEDLHEHDRGNVSHLSQEQFRALVHEFFQKPDQLVFGQETAENAHARFYRAVHSILNEHKNKTIVIVSHGTVISLFVSRLTGSSDFELWSMLGLPSYIAIDLHSNTLIVKDKIS